MDAIEYTPTQPKKETPKPEYVLVEDVTGKPPPKRGPQILEALRYVKDKDGKEQKEITKFKTPYPPKPYCKKCFGRGYIGFEPRSGNIYLCKKCYPMV